MTEINLTKAQYDALPRVFASFPSREATKRVTIQNIAPSFVRVTYSAGWGEISFDIDLDGNAAHVNFGVSEISLEVENYV